MRCCLPRAREHCRRRGWSLLAISISDEVDPDKQNARPDTLPTCFQELRRCLSVSAGPAMLTLLDRSTGLVGPLPPSSLPAVEYSKLLEYFHSASSNAPSMQALGSEAPAAAVPEHGGQLEQAGLRLLRRWYRQTRHTSTGKPDGDYVLLTPPDLARPEDSIFAPEASAQRLSQQQRTQYAAHELALLGSALAHAALAALYPAKETEAPPLSPALPVVLERGASGNPTTPAALATAAAVSSPSGGGGGEGGGGWRVDGEVTALTSPAPAPVHQVSELQRGPRGEGESGVGGGVTPLNVVTGSLVGGVEDSTVATGSSLRERRKSRVHLVCVCVLYLCSRWIHVNGCVCARVCSYTHVYKCINVCVYVCVYACMHVRMYV